MTEIKIFPNAIQLPKGRISQERLIPFFVPTKQSGFLGLKSGKIYHHGILSSLGETITSENILETYVKSHELPRTKKECLAILDKYLKALEAFKAGNVISIRYSKSGEFSLLKVMNTPPVEQVRLP